MAQPQVGADRIRKDNLTIITTATGNAIMCDTLNKIATKFDVCAYRWQWHGNECRHRIRAYRRHDNNDRDYKPRHCKQRGIKPPKSR